MKEKDIEYLKRYLSEDKIIDGIKKLENGIPVQYIVGNVDFCGNIIDVDARVLIPRFETELLVDKTISYVNKYFGDTESLKILDIGTGSGCIAISLKKALRCDMTAIDISSDALAVAFGNAINNDVDIDFRLSDVFDSIHDKFDVIVSNPPYISHNEEIEEIVMNNEPHSALFAADNGLYFYDKILRECSYYLNNKFIICFEIGYKQGDAIKKLVSKYLDNVKVSVEKDYSGKDRFVFIFKK